MEAKHCTRTRTRIRQSEHYQRIASTTCSGPKHKEGGLAGQQMSTETGTLRADGNSSRSDSTVRSDNPWMGTWSCGIYVRNAAITVELMAAFTLP